MSTLRKLRRMMVTPHELSGPQKPLVKIADLPEDERRLARHFIRHQLEKADVQQVIGISLDVAAQRTEDLIDAGALNIDFYESPESSGPFISALYNKLLPSKF